MLSGAGLGIWLRNFLPEDHISGDSKETLRTTSGLLATLVALILGLLVSSAKSSFDATNTTIMNAGAEIISLDHILSRYGPEAKDVRQELRQGVAALVKRIWPSETVNVKDSDSFGGETVKGMESTNYVGPQDVILKLSPKNDTQRFFKSEALQVGEQIQQSRWMFIEQLQNPIPVGFLIVMTFWLASLFVSFGLLAPQNRTMIVALFFAAISMAAAVFLIFELNSPLEGIIKVSNAPMQKALEVIAK